MMRPARVVGAIATIARMFSMVLLIPFLVALVYEPWTYDVALFAIPRNALVFLASFGAMAIIWGPVLILTRAAREENLRDREAYLTVGIGWLTLALLATIPFLLGGLFTSPVDAFFEAMSGVTTTGATTIEGTLEDVAPSLMFWRAMLQYLGGMGIVVLGVALLAKLSQGGTSLFTAEAPGTTVTRIRPKLAQTAKALWKVYGALAALLAAILFSYLLWQGMTFKEAIYEATLHTLTTLSTGGFSNHSASISFFDSVFVEGVIIVFMLLAGTNFTLLYYSSKGASWRLWRDPEWRFYMTIFVLATLAVTGILWRAGGELFTAFRGAAFTSASLLTSTGFGTADFDTWPPVAKMIVLILMATGGSLGSTAGGLKVIRILILLRLVRQQIQSVIHPRGVIPIRIANRPVGEGTLMVTTAFFFSFVGVWIIGALVIVLTDPAVDLVDGIAASLSATSNMGPALGIAGPTRGYWDFQPLSKTILALQMWAGRLEIFTALLIFNPNSWRN